MLIAVTAVENFVSFQPNVQALVAGLFYMLAVLLSPQLQTAHLYFQRTELNYGLEPAFSLVSGFAVVSPLTYTSQIFN